MTKNLKLTKLFQGNRVTEMDVWRGGVDTKFDPQWATKAKFFKELFFREDFSGAGRELGELLFWRHERKESESYADEEWLVDGGCQALIDVESAAASHGHDFYLPKPWCLVNSAAPHEMVVVAQLVEPRIVIPVVAGSSPVDHPIFPIGTSVEVWKGGEEP